MTQRYIQFQFEGIVIRGIEHVPETKTPFPCPVVLMIPGLGGAMGGPHRMLLEISRLLEKMGIASVRFDFLGNGESDGIFSQSTLTNQTRQTLLIMDHLKRDQRFDNSRMSLLGFSMGGLVAAMSAGYSSTLVNRLILLSPTFNLPFIARSIKSNNPVGVDEYNYYGNRFGPEFLEDIIQTNIEEVCRWYDKSALIISGGKDTLVRNSVTSNFVQRVYGGRVKHLEIEGADHAFQDFRWKDFIIETCLKFMVEKNDPSKHILTPKDPVLSGA